MRRCQCTTRQHFNKAQLYLCLSSLPLLNTGFANTTFVPNVQGVAIGSMVPPEDW